MSFFDESDDFDDVVNQFFGGGRRRSPRRTINEEEERTIDFIETQEFAYAIFELPGYDEEDVKVNVDGRLIEVSAKKRTLEDVKEYLASKLSSGVIYQKALPENLNFKDFDYSLKNGVLEIKFRKKK